MAAKNKIVYICSNCGFESAKWAGKCPDCGEWNTMEESVKTAVSAKSAASGYTSSASTLLTRPLAISEIDTEDEHRYHTGLSELDRVLGGGLVKGSLVLISGDPGIGKSTILLQICEYLGQKLRILYVSGEESARQIKLRAGRLGVSSPNLRILAETDVQLVVEHIRTEKPVVHISLNPDPEDRLSDDELTDIAAELNLGADSFVFADDNPAERAIVAAQVPGVAVPALDGAENYIKMLDHGGYFEVTALSKEDLKKTELYHQNAQRAKAQASFSDYGEYLDSLEMTATIKDFEPLYIQRIAQLTNKSNQFNLTTLRCSEDDIRAMAENPAWLCRCGKLVDKFGDNGIVTVTAGEQEGETLHLRLWLMSCRVLKRGMEDAMMDIMVANAAARGVKTIRGYYYPTVKNAMVREFYASFGFEKVEETEDGSTTWQLDVAAYQPKHPHMKIER